MRSFSFLREGFVHVHVRVFKSGMKDWKKWFRQNEDHCETVALEMTKNGKSYNLPLRARQWSRIQQQHQYRHPHETTTTTTITILPLLRRIWMIICKHSCSPTCRRLKFNNMMLKRIQTLSWSTKNSLSTGDNIKRRAAMINERNRQQNSSFFHSMAQQPTLPDPFFIMYVSPPKVFKLSFSSPKCLNFIPK